MIKWNTFKTKIEDYHMISKIATRACKSIIQITNHKNMVMDLDCAFNDVDLDLQKLLDFPDSDFQHDIFGILYNINRTTGKIDNCFLPRASS